MYWPINRDCCSFRKTISDIPSHGSSGKGFPHSATIVVTDSSLYDTMNQEKTMYNWITISFQWIQHSEIGSHIRLPQHRKLRPLPPKSPWARTAPAWDDGALSFAGWRCTPRGPWVTEPGKNSGGPKVQRWCCFNWMARLCDFSHNKSGGVSTQVNHWSNLWFNLPIIVVVTMIEIL